MLQECTLYLDWILWKEQRRHQFRHGSAWAVGFYFQSRKERAPEKEKFLSLIKNKGYRAWEDGLVSKVLAAWLWKEELLDLQSPHKILQSVYKSDTLGNWAQEGLWGSLAEQANSRLTRVSVSQSKVENWMKTLPLASTHNSTNEKTCTTQIDTLPHK